VHLNVHILRKSVLFFVRIQVQYRKSGKNVTFSSTNHDLFLKKEHFFQIKNIFDSKKRTSLAPLRYWT
jgi:dihydroorotase-like cyclic amidohydrolase